MAALVSVGGVQWNVLEMARGVSEVLKNALKDVPYVPRRSPDSRLRQLIADTRAAIRRLRILCAVCEKAKSLFFEFGL